MNGQYRDIIACLSFVATAVNVALAVYVLSKNPRRTVNQLFALVALSLAVWAFGDAMYNVSSSVSLRAFWVRFQAPGQILFPAFFLNLALVFPSAFFLAKGRSLKPLQASLYLPALFTLVAFYSTDWVLEFRTIPGTMDLTGEGWLYWVYAVFSYTLLIAALSLYVYSYYRSRRLREKRIAQVMVAAVAVPLAISILENARLYTLSSAPCFFTITAAVFAYGILKYQMFTEVEQVLRRSIVYFTLTVVITSAYILTIVISERFISSYFSAQGYVITALFVFLMVLAFEPLRRWLMRVVDRSFFRKDYEFGQLLSSLARTLMELSSLDEISREITDTLTDNMGLTGAALLYDPLGEGDWRKRALSGFTPEYLRDTPPELRLEEDTLYLERGPGGEASFKVVEVPLVFERETVGTLLLGEKLSGYDLSFSDRSLLEAMAPQMAVALKNGALYQDVLEKQGRVNELMDRVTVAHEDERRRISRELHDGVAQSFLGVVYLSEFTLESLEEDIEEARKDLVTLAERAREGLDELRTVINDLRPIPLEVLGLKGAAGKLVRDVATAGEMKVSLDSNLGERERLPLLLEGNLYRILQEGLNNVGKHAGAGSVAVSLMRDDDRVTLRVSDDGKGMPPSAASSTPGMGMTSMRERAREMGGELRVESEENRGTTVTVTVPLTRGER
ncbi:MAG: hypothetical protein KKB90_04630 [Actinobacteria bacterium]|nr:hypothetical protein [Actinomycetota bacterium]MCG2818580.1 histidine kinase [Actinomycetes bacterium]MBU4218231.1 hypothetical protein [Actinomycetota bacterium]MBU4358656.1 hypothetical protein [Actinomycetota bacterium]MBU4392029.1 hypothetical protein [Actinomycetota bacterium]